MGRQPQLLIVLTLLALGAIGVYTWQFFRAAQQLPVVRLATADVGMVSTSIATLEASPIRSCQTSKLKSGLAATVWAVHAAPGDSVIRDKALVDLDNQSLREDLARARNALDQARHALEAACGTARARLRTIDILRRDSVADATHASSQPFDNPDQENPDCLRAKEFEHETALQYRDLIAKQASLHVQAPFDGIVTDVAVQTGQAITAGSVLLSIADNSCLNVRVKLPASDGKRLSVGAQACLRTPALAQPDCSARLTHVNSNGGNNGSIYAEAVVELQKLPASVSLGGTVSVSFPLNSAADATRIPRPCLAGDGQSVFQLDEKRGTVVRRPLEIGLRGNDFVEVLSGIAPGQHLVMPLTRTPANLKDGTSVRVVLHER